MKFNVGERVLDVHHIDLPATEVTAVWRHCIPTEYTCQNISTGTRLRYHEQDLILEDEVRSKDNYALKQACALVEIAFKACRVARMELEYSDGCTLSGTKGSATAVDLYTTITSLTKKVNNA